MIEYGPVLTPNVVWDSWTPEFQAIVTEAARQTEAYATGHIQARAQADEEAMIAAGAKRVVFENKEEFRKLIPDMRQVWLERQTAEGRGEEARQIVDITKKINQ